MSEKQTIKPKKASKKPALGRGLGSLLGTPSLETKSLDESQQNTDKTIEKVNFASKEEGHLPHEFIEEREVKSTAGVPEAARIWQIGIEKLKGHPNQPRKDFDSTGIKELALSIKEQGILQPIVAQKLSENEFRIIAGERRWRAAQQAGLDAVPVILKKATEQEALELALIENIQREDLNPIEEAEAYQWIMNQHVLTQQELAKKLGKERVTIANALRLLKLHPDLRTYLKAGELSQGQAKVLLGIADKDIQKKIGFQVIKKKMTVRETTKLVEQSLKSQSKENSFNKEIDEIDISGRLIKGLAQEMQKLMGTRVAIDYSHGKGKLKINFYSDSELDELIERLRGAWKK